MLTPNIDYIGVELRFLIKKYLLPSTFNEVITEAKIENQRGSNYSQILNFLAIKDISSLFNKKGGVLMIV